MDPGSTDRLAPMIAVTADHAAKLLGMPYTSFMDRVHRREIACVVYGGGHHRKRRVFLLDDLRAWACRHRIPAAWEDRSDADGGDGRHLREEAR